MNQANHYERPESEVIRFVFERNICSVKTEDVQVSDPWASGEGDEEEVW